MRHLALYWLVLSTGFLFFMACSDKVRPTPQTSTPELDRLLEDSAFAENGKMKPMADTSTPGLSDSPVTPAKIVVQEDSEYGAAFLNQLSMAGLAKSFELTDSLIIVEDKDTFFFPETLPKGDWVNFMAMKSGYAYSLDLARINYTTLDFNFELRKGNATIDQILGKAVLSPGFILAAESDEDPVTGISYFSDEYFFKNETCEVSIRVGDDEGIRKVKMIKNCKSGKYNIALEDCPVLLEK